MKNLTKVTVALLLLVALFLVVSCEASGKNALIGKWEATIEEGSKAIYEFSKDGKFKETYEMGEHSSSREGTFEVEEETLILQYCNDDGQLELKFSVKKNVLTLTQGEFSIDLKKV